MMPRSNSPFLQLLRRSEAYVDQIYHRLADVYDHQTLQPVTLLFRLGILILIAARPFLWAEYYSPTSLNIWIGLTLLLALYDIALIFSWRKFPDTYVSSKSQVFQVIVDILIFTLFVLASGDIETDVVFAFLLPLIIAARYFPVFYGLAIYAIVVLLMSVSLWTVGQQPSIQPAHHQLWHVLIIRSALFIMVTAALYRVASLHRKRDIEAQQFERRLGLLNSLGAELATPYDLATIMKRATRQACEELNAESAALFIEENGYFVRREIFPQSNEWFPTERYERGEGFTGQVAHSHNSDGFGKAKCENNVHRNLHVIKVHRSQYERVLPSGKVQSLLAVPLNGPEYTFGILRVVNKKSSQVLGTQAREALDKNGFTPEDTALLQSIGAMVSLAYSARRGIEKLELILSFENTRLVNDYSAAAQNIADTLVRFGYDACSVLLSNGYNQLEMDGCSGFQEEELLELRSVLGTQHSTLESNIVGPFVLNLDRHPDPSLANWARSYHWSTLLRIPIVFEQQSLGLLEVYTRTPFRFYQSDIAALDTFASRAGVVLEKAGLLEESRMQVQRMKDLAELTKEVTKTADENHLFQRACSDAANLLDAEDCTIFWIDPKTSDLRMRASHRIPEEFFDQKLTRVSAEPRAGLPSWVAATGEPYGSVGDEYQTHPAWQGTYFGHFQFLPSGRCHSIYLAPIRDDLHRVVGVIKVENKCGLHWQEGFSALDRELLDRYSTQVAIISRRITHLQNLQELNVLAQETFLRPGTLQATLEQIVKAAARVLPTDMIQVSPFDTKKGEYRTGEYVAVGQITDMAPAPKPREDGLTHYVLNCGLECIPIQDFEERPEWISDFTNQERIRASIVAPLRFRDDLLGIIYFNYRTPRKFTQEEIEYAKSFARLAAIALYTAGEYSTTHYMPRLTTALADPGKSMSVDSLTEFLVNEVVDRLGYDFCTIHLVNESEGMVVGIKAKGLQSPEWLPRSVHRLDSTDIQAWIVRNNQTQVLTKDDPRFDPEIFGPFEHQDLVRVFVPLRGHDKVIGTVEAGYHVSRRKTIPQSEADSLTSYVHQFGAFLAERLAHENLDQYNAALRRLVSFSQQLNAEITAETDLQLFRLACEMIESTTASDAYVIMELSEPIQGIFISPRAKAKKLETHAFFESAIFQAARKNVRPLYPKNSAYGVTVLCLPLSFEDTLSPKGVATVFYDQEHFFTPEEKSLLEFCVAQIGISVRLHHAHNQVRANLEHQGIEMRTFFHSKPGSDMLNIRNKAEILLADQENPLNSEQQKTVKLIEQSAQSLVANVERWGMARRLKAGGPNLRFAEVPPDYGIAEAIEFHETRIAAKQHAVELLNLDDVHSSIYADAGMLETLWQELLHNAIKFTDPGGKISVCIREEGRYVRILFKDTGRGIPPSAHHAIFEEYYREIPLKSDDEAGSGLGLMIAEQIVKQHFGSIWVESKLNQGATFIVQLPKINLPAGRRQA